MGMGWMSRGGSKSMTRELCSIDRRRNKAHVGGTLAGQAMARCLRPA